MLNAEAILEQAQHGPIPDNWTVYRVERYSAVGLGVVAAVVTLVILAILLLAITVLLPLFSVSILTVATPINLTIVAVIAVIIAVVVGLMVAGRAVHRATRSLLIMTPEGFVQRLGASERSVKAIAYADIASMKLKTVTQSNSSKVNISLEMHYPDGHVETWIPAPGPADEVAQLMIATHARYESGVLPQPPPVPQPVLVGEDQPVLVEEDQPPPVFAQPEVVKGNQPVSAIPQLAPAEAEQQPPVFAQPEVVKGNQPVPAVDTTINDATKNDMVVKTLNGSEEAEV